MSTESLEKFIQNIREQIALGEMQDALDQLQNYLSGSAPKLQNEVLLHASRYNRLRRDERKALISRDVAQAEQNRLVNDLSEFLEEIPKHISLEMSPSPALVPTTETLSLPDDLGFEKILGINNLKQISWIQRGLEVSKSVCRILTPTGRGTGFLISPTCLMTNNHVIPSPDIAGQAQAEFNYQQDESGNYLPTYRFRLRPDLFHTSPLHKLDYSIVGVETGPDRPPLENWGYLSLNPAADPIPSEHVIIIQHPNGGLKQIALTANQVVNSKEHRLYYTTDTMPGSSGSPVFNDLWQVIAIHHAYGGLKQDAKGNSRYTNEGILMSAIRADAGNYWPEQ